MKISYAVTVSTEVDEIKRLFTFLMNKKKDDDEIVVLYDEKNGKNEILDFLLPHNLKPNVQTWRGIGFKNNFAEWKNKLSEYCVGDYIFQIDADEMISDYLIENIHDILESNPEVELMYFPRINVVDGIDESHIKMWNWKINENGWVNFPDYQGRLYKKGLKWENKVHERIINAKFYSLLPTEKEYCIIHHKTIEKQIRQNELYSKI